MTEQDAVERVADAMWDRFDQTKESWESLVARAPRHHGCKSIVDRYRKQATAAIAAHTAYLRERAQSPEVVEAAAKARMQLGLSRSVEETTIVTLTAALDAMFGKDDEFVPCPDCGGSGIASGPDPACPMCGTHGSVPAFVVKEPRDAE